MIFHTDTLFYFYSVYFTPFHVQPFYKTELPQKAVQQQSDSVTSGHSVFISWLLYCIVLLMVFMQEMSFILFLPPSLTLTSHFAQHQNKIWWWKVEIHVHDVRILQYRYIHCRCSAAVILRVKWGVCVRIGDPDKITLHLTLRMSAAKAIETSVTTTNSLSQDYCSLL